MAANHNLETSCGNAFANVRFCDELFAELQNQGSQCADIRCAGIVPAINQRDPAIGARMILRSAAYLVLAVFVLAPAVSCAAESGVDWMHDLKKAAGESRRTGKPILLQFKADWCGYCHKMLRETFPDRDLARKINACFVPVVLDADEHEEIVETIGIRAFPSTIIISSKLDVIGRVRGFHTPRSLEKKLLPFCDRERLAAVTPDKGGQAGKEIPPPPRLPVASIAAPALEDPEKPGEVPEAAERKPAFGGFCLVSMLNERKRVPGSSEHEATFERRTLYFSSEKHLTEFQANPEKFWPMLDGQCPVSRARGEKLRTGDPRTVAVFRGQLVFFRDLAHRNDFAENPRGYLQASAK